MEEKRFGKIRPLLKWIGLGVGLIIGIAYLLLSTKDLNPAFTILRIGAIGFLLGVVLD